MPVVSPDFSGGYYGEATYAGGGGYDPYANYSGATAPSFAGGYYGEATYSGGGGYDPTTGFAGTSNTIGGQAAITENYTGAPSYAGGYYGDQEAWSGGGYDPAAERLNNSGLPAGGAFGATGTPSIGFQNAGGTVSQYSDWRVRVALSPSNAIFYNDASNALMRPLAETGGVIFPYTPSVRLTHQAIYTPKQLTHSNYASMFYQGSDVSDITITGQFTVQDQHEGQYLLAAIYFFRAATKMFFGLEGADKAGAGNPPPIVYLDGYGEHYLPHVPCVLTSFSHDLETEVDYIEVPISSTSLVEKQTSPIPGSNAGAGQIIPGILQSPSTRSSSYGYSTTTKTTRLPTNSTVSITLKPVYSRRSVFDKFNLSDFAAGKLVGGNGGFI